MSNEWKEDTMTPTLVFGEVPEKEEIVEVKKEEPAFDDSMLSVAEKKMVEDFSKQIDLNNTNAILQYGSGTQKKIANFSEAALENVKTKDLGQVGDMLTDVVNELRDFDAEEEKGFLSIFKKQANKLSTLKAKYEKAEVNVEKICDALETHQVQLMKDVALLDKMYDQNLAYFKELTMYVMAGKKKLAQIRATELPELVSKAKMTGLAEDAQAAKDLEEKCTRFEKKIHDLELTRTIAMQTAPQIRLVQNSDTMMIEKIQSTVVNTIPLWKSQMVLALGVEHASQAAAAQRQVTDMTNQLLRKNAETLKIATVEAARESERGIVDLETLQNTNAALISTLDEVMQIQTEGKAKRRAAEAELQKMENELKNKLLEIR
ncbi:MAG: toxic anion resistance protein [Ruminococcus sp.]|nr:toxic anion resistance protein [Ruminococcus sp.]